MKRLLLASAMSIAAGSTGLAQTAPPVLDPLHMCYVGGCSAFNGVTIGNPPGAGLSGFGVTSSPAPQTGDLWFAILVPDNDTEVVFPSVTGEFGGTNVSVGPFVSEGFFGPMADLGSLFGGTSPPNPINSYQAATEAVDPGFTSADGYNVFLVQITGNGTMGSVTTVDSGQVPPTNNSFSFGGGDFEVGVNPTEFTGLPQGTIVTAFLNEVGFTGPHETDGIVSTAQSSALLLDATPTLAVPEAPTWALMLVGFFSVAVGAAFRRRVRVVA